MKQPFNIKVEDIITDDYEDGENCPFAQAFRRQFPNYPTRIEVGRSNVYLSKTFDVIATIEDDFGLANFEQLQKGIEFNTQIII